MNPKVEFHFDFGSPNAFLAHQVIPEIESRTGVTFQYVPVLLGGVFKATNNTAEARSLAGIKNKSEYQSLEMQRFVAKHGLMLNFNPHFPVNTLQIMRGAVAAQKIGLETFRQYVDVVFNAMWLEPKKMDEQDVISAVLSLNAIAVTAAQSSAPEVKAELIANTEDSVNRGTFGSPSFFVGRELFFGKDRLYDLEQEIIFQQSSGEASSG